MNMKMNLNDLQKYFGCEAEPASKEQERLVEVTNKLLNDVAIKEWLSVMDAIQGMVGDVRGQVEAIAFCRVYLKKMVTLADEVAQEMGIPEEIAAILAKKVAPMVAFSIQDRYDAVTKNSAFMEELAAKAKGAEALTDNEVCDLEAEKLELEMIVAEQEDSQEEENDQGEDVGQKYGTLDPKNPFGLN